MQRIPLEADQLPAPGERVELVLFIDRADIERGHYAPTLNRLMALTDTAETTRQFRDSLDFTVTGYDHEVRSIFEIDAVRAFFGLLSAQWPHWLWFLSRRNQVVGQFLGLLCQLDLHAPSPDLIRFSFRNPDEVRAVLNDLLERGHPLFQMHGISDIEIRRSVHSITIE